MALFDFLKPKWQRSNPQSRIAGIAELQDEAILVGLAENDTESSVRDAALRRLDEVRPKWQHSKPDVRRQAVSKLKHEKVLSKLAQSDTDETVRGAALRRLDEVRPKWQHSEREVRKDAIATLNDQSALKKLMERDPDESVRAAAAERLSRVRSEWREREVSRIKNLSTGDRMEAVEKIRDRDVLIDILSLEIRRGDGTVWTPGKWIDDADQPCAGLIADIVERLPQDTQVQALLERLALDTTKNPNNRRVPVENLLNTEVLWRIAEEDPIDWIREYAEERLKSLPQPQSDHADPEVRKQAIKHLRDESALRELSEQDPDEGVRRFALERQKELRRSGQEKLDALLARIQAGEDIGERAAFDFVLTGTAPPGSDAVLRREMSKAGESATQNPWLIGALACVAADPKPYFTALLEPMRNADEGRVVAPLLRIRADGSAEMVPDVRDVYGGGLGAALGYMAAWGANTPAMNSQNAMKRALSVLGEKGRNHLLALRSNFASQIGELLDNK